MNHFWALFILSGFLLNACTEKKIPKYVETTCPRIEDTTLIAIDTNQYLYDFIKMLEKDQQLNYSYGLTLEVQNSLSHKEDNTYLLKFIKGKPETITYYPMGIKRKDTLLADSTIVQLKPEPFIFTTSALSIANPLACLTKADIKYMLAEKIRLQKFSWNNQRLGFNLSNKNNWYVFSLPYFSKDKKKALISIRSLCKPFLCGGGYVLLYRYEDNKWKSTKVDYWIH